VQCAAQYDAVFQGVLCVPGADHTEGQRAVSGALQVSHFLRGQLCFSVPHKHSDRQVSSVSAVAVTKSILQGHGLSGLLSPGLHCWCCKVVRSWCHLEALNLVAASAVAVTLEADSCGGYQMIPVV
jgi:hypothetical protein